MERFKPQGVGAGLAADLGPGVQVVADVGRERHKHSAEADECGSLIGRVIQTKDCGRKRRRSNDGPLWQSWSSAY